MGMESEVDNLRIMALGTADETLMGIRGIAPAVKGRPGYVAGCGEHQLSNRIAEAHYRHVMRESKSV